MLIAANRRKLLIVVNRRKLTQNSDATHAISNTTELMTLGTTLLTTIIMAWELSASAA
jgi:hypothetical protein